MKLSRTRRLSLGCSSSCFGSCAGGGSCHPLGSAASVRTVSESSESMTSASVTSKKNSTTAGTTDPLMAAPGAAYRLATVRAVEYHPDSRGSVAETYRASWFPEVPPIKQLVQSNSKAGTLRGMHLHKRQWDIWRFTSDKALVRLYDPATGDNEFIVGDKTNVIAIPPGIAHGFYTESGCTLVYALTEEYDGSDEFGFYPFDGWVRDGWRNWPAHHDGLHVSERDLRAPRLVDFLESL